MGGTPRAGSTPAISSVSEVGSGGAGLQKSGPSNAIRAYVATREGSHTCCVAPGRTGWDGIRKRNWMGEPEPV